MAKPAVHKNKPRFFSVLLTLIFVGAAVFGVYKVRALLSVNTSPALVPGDQSAADDVSPTSASKPETTTAADADALAAAKAIGEADESLSPAFLSYIAENCDAKALQTVLGTMEKDKKDYDKEIWYTATGKSFYALNALADGSVQKGLVREIESEGKTIEIGFAGKVNLASAGTVSEDLQKIMQNMDIQVLNSECALSSDSKTAKYLASAKSAELYKQLGVDLAAVANGHIADYGADAVALTLKTLDDLGVSHTGAGANVTEASKPASFIVNGRRITFLSASDTYPGRTGRAATASGYGVFSMYDSNFEAVKNAVKAAKAESDYVFVYIQAGIDENADWFDNYQDKWSKALIDAGADGVVGAHSNRLQGMEFYKGKLIVYGLGNFLYDEKTRETGIYKVAIGKDGKLTHTFIPCSQSGGNVSLCTAAADKTAVFNRVSRFCGNVVKVDSDGTIRNNRR